MGSAADQKMIPTAMVVHNTTANQLNRDKSGLASSPSIFTLPNGEKKTPITTNTMENCRVQKARRGRGHGVGLV